MAIAAGAEEQQQEPRLPTPAPEPAEPAGLQYERLDAGDAVDQDDFSQSGLDHSETSEQSWTTDDEGEAAVNGNQMWSMSFEWQDGNADDTSEAVARFEDTTDFAKESTELTSSPTNAAESVSSHTSHEAAELSPADPDWVQPWEQTDADIQLSPVQAKANGAPSQQSSAKQKAKPQPMSEEHKTAILGAMKNVKIDYVPRWAMYLEESRWLDSIKNKAAKVMCKA